MANFDPEERGKENETAGKAVKSLRKKRKKSEPNLTFTIVDGEKFPNQFRAADGSVQQSEKGTFVTKFGDVKKIPKPGFKAKRKERAAGKDAEFREETRRLEGGTKRR